MGLVQRASGGDAGRYEMIRIRDLSLPAREDGQKALLRAAARALGVGEGEISELKIRRRSVDARKKGDVRLIYTVDAALTGSEAAVLRADRSGKLAPAEAYIYAPPRAAHMPAKPPVVVGFGPAGMFAGLILAMAGLCPIILERGGPVEERARAVSRFWETGELNTGSNVQFGEGGAGAFSDGKLNTGTKNPRIQWVLDTFARFGAAENVTFDAKPHVGTDRLRTVVKNLREKIMELGGQVRFYSALTDIRVEKGRVTGVTVNGVSELACDALILAVGHSARDTFEMLSRRGVPMEPKAFAMGARIEHRQRDIDLAQYGPFAGTPSLGAADYKLIGRLHLLHVPRRVCGGGGLGGGRRGHQRHELLRARWGERQLRPFGGADAGGFPGNGGPLGDVLAAGAGAPGL